MGRNDLTSVVSLQCVRFTLMAGRLLWTFWDEHRPVPTSATAAGYCARSATIKKESSSYQKNKTLVVSIIAELDVAEDCIHLNVRFRKKKVFFSAQLNSFHFLAILRTIAERLEAISPEYCNNRQMCGGATERPISKNCISLAIQRPSSKVTKNRIAVDRSEGFPRPADVPE